MKSHNKTTNYYKYPRTFHLPYSPKRGSDDKVLIDDSDFEGKQVIVMEKMDGENTSMYADYLHARSIDSTKDESHRWLERFRNTILPQLEHLNKWRICGENLFYKHTVFYQDLESIFLAYSIWVENQLKNETENQSSTHSSNYSLSWQETKTIFDKIGISYPNIIYEGIYDKKKILERFESYKTQKDRKVEGFVIRLEDSFLYKDFSKSVAKYVCDDFEITSSKHWRYEAKTLNQLKNNQNVWTKIL